MPKIRAVKLYSSYNNIDEYEYIYGSSTDYCDVSTEDFDLIKAYIDIYNRLHSDKNYRFAIVEYFDKESSMSTIEDILNTARKYEDKERARKKKAKQ